MLPVLVVGLGPAGASTAIFLAQLGLDVVAIDKKGAPVLQIGESLPPDANKLLQQLGVWQAFTAANHQKCYGNKSYWNSDKPSYHDFLQYPEGHGWHIDRPGFESMLRDKAKSMGVHINLQTRIDSFEYNGNHWEVALTHDKQTAIQLFSFIIDATGRNSWIARRQGIDRLYEDQQLALVAFLQSKSHFKDTTSLIETVEHGWWYSAKIPGNLMATAFLFKPGEIKQTVSTDKDNWWKLVSQAQHSAKRLTQCDFTLLNPPKIVAADSGILEKVYGDGWLAVGDAAMTYDPIASHGLMMSMVSARDAAIAIHETLNGQEDKLKQYGQRMYQSFLLYSKVRQSFYSEKTPA
ncbi:MAG: NAD(P)/FAD-dependent oxidoreductase [Alteromonadaceae bacterium]|nr:NAD(P)/FAD-dependent oxidoreductase [Alteromonadaceae bacterium]